MSSPGPKFVAGLRGARNVFLVAAIVAMAVWVQTSPRPDEKKSTHYLNLGTPSRVLVEAQPWEGNQAPHTLSVVELQQGGFRYWGWYGLNEGRGIGLARSNDLVNWTKYEQNPLWTNARWPSVLANADPAHPDILYFALTRDYDTPSSRIVLATSSDGIHLREEKDLVKAVTNERNQNPNLFHDPVSKRFYLTFYRGNDRDQFAIVSKNAESIVDLDKAPEKVLMRSTTTLAAPSLLYVKSGKDTSGKTKGLYYLATEVYPHRYTGDPEGEWRVRVFVGDSPDGEFEPAAGNPIMSGQRACLFQHVFDGRFVGYNCHVASGDQWVLEEVDARLP